MRKKRWHFLTVVVGSVLALAIAFSHLSAPDCLGLNDADTAAHSQDNTAGDTAAFISLPSFSLPAPVHVQGSLNPWCLFEIILEEDIDEIYVEENVFYADRFFQTMFRVIISPNAP